MNNGALIRVPARKDEQYLNTVSLSTRSKGASGGLPGINTILKIQFTCSEWLRHTPILIFVCFTLCTFEQVLKTKYML